MFHYEWVRTRDVFLFSIYIFFLPRHRSLWKPTNLQDSLHEKHMTLTSVFFDTMEFSISQRTNIFCISFSCSFAEFFHADLCFSSSSLSLSPFNLRTPLFNFKQLPVQIFLCVCSPFRLSFSCHQSANIAYIKWEWETAAAQTVCVCVFLSHNFKRFSSHIIIFFRASRENKKVKNGRFYCTKITSVPNTAFTAFHEYIAEACVWAFEDVWVSV